jgi:hypothetical protein
MHAAFTLNQFQRGVCNRILEDLPEETLFRAGAGHGHSPAWILGHLAITGEMGQMLLGGRVTHRDWIPLFAPGSSGVVESRPGLEIAVFASAIGEAYEGLTRLASEAQPSVLARPHGVEILKNTPLRSVEDVLLHLLTSHFGFHLAQLSSCRREAGHARLL